MSLEAVSVSSKPKSSDSHFVCAIIAWAASGLQYWLTARRARDGNGRYAAEWTTTSFGRAQIAECLWIMFDSDMIGVLILKDCRNGCSW